MLPEAEEQEYNGEHLGQCPPCKMEYTSFIPWLFCRPVSGRCAPPQLHARSASLCIVILPHCHEHACPALPLHSHQPGAAITALPPAERGRRWKPSEPRLLPPCCSLVACPLPGGQACLRLSLGPQERELTGHRGLLLLLFLIVLLLLPGQLPEFRKVHLQQLGNCLVG